MLAAFTITTALVRVAKQLGLLELAIGPAIPRDSAYVGQLDEVLVTSLLLTGR